jgi:hypothetical protein
MMRAHAGDRMVPQESRGSGVGTAASGQRVATVNLRDTTTRATRRDDAARRTIDEMRRCMLA